MNNPNEAEKLTLDSRNSYDKNRIIMAEKDNDFQAEESEETPEVLDKGTKGSEDSEDDEERRTALEKKEKQGKLAKILAALFFPESSESAKAESDAAFEALVKFVAAEKPPHDTEETDEEVESMSEKTSVSDLAELLLLVSAGEELDPHSSDDDLQRAEAIPTIFEKIFAIAEDVGFDSEVLSDKLVQLAEKKEQAGESLPTQHEERVAQLSDFLTKEIELSSKEALEDLEQELETIKGITEAGSDAQKSVEAAVTALEQVLKNVEVHTDTAEDLDAQEREFEQRLAGVIVRVFDKMAEEQLKAEHAREAEEKKQAMLLMNTLLTKETPEDLKVKLTAGLLLEEEFRTDGLDAEAAQIVSAKRKKILDFAEKAGLPKEAITIEEAFVASEFSEAVEQVNDLESVEALTAFEALVAEQIEHAPPKEVAEIQKAWKEIQKTVDPKSDIGKQAKEAISILGKIIALKEDILEAEARGGRVDIANHPLPFVREDLEEEGSDLSAAEKEEKKNELASILAALFTSVRPSNSEEEQGVISIITDLVLSTKATNKEKQEALDAIAAFFPVSGKEREKIDVNGLHGYLAMYAISTGMQVPEVQERELKENVWEYAREGMEKFLRENLKDASKYDLDAMRHGWVHILLSENLLPVTKMQMEDSVRILESLIGQPIAHDTSRRHLEQPISVEKEKKSEKHSKNNELDKFLDEVKSVNALEDYSTLTVDRFKQYNSDLENVLNSGQEISETQLMSAYIAYMTQRTVLRREAERNGTFTNSFQEIERKTLPLMSQLLNRVKAANTDGFNENMAQINTILRQQEQIYEDQTGFTFAAQVKNAHSPILVDAQDQWGRSIGRESYVPRDTATELLQVAAASGAPISNPSQLEQTLGQEMQQFKSEIQSREIRNQRTYAIESELERMSTRLQELVSNAAMSNQSLRNQSEAQTLARAMMQQRNELARLRGYRGLIETRAEMDPALYDGYVHEVLGERMRRIKVGLGDTSLQQIEGEGYESDELKRYYDELRRWATILINNDVRRRPELASDPNVLRLSNERFEAFKKIAETEIGDIAANRDVVLNNLNYMLDGNRGNFLRYFKQNAPDPTHAGELLGVRYQPPDDNGQYSPESLGATMRQLAKEYGADYETGGKYELINAEGEFMYHNFYYWIRKKINEDVDYNKEGQINPFGKIIIKLDMGQISMYELLLLIPEYTSQRNFEIRMNNGNRDETYSGWGDKREHPNFGLEQLGTIAAEMEFRQMTHELRMQFQDTSVSGGKDQYLGLMKKLHDNNHWTRAANIFLMLGLPSSRVNGKQEIDDWLGSKEKQGSLGKAMSDMIVAYYYLSEMTDFHKVKERDSKGKVIERTKNFNENMFYRFLEPNGANRYLLKMAEGALGYNADAKKMYAAFIKKRIYAAAEEYKRGRSAEEQKRIMQIADEQLPDETVEINFTESTHLTNFLTTVERQVMGDTSNKKDFDGKIAIKVKESMVKNLKKDYFEDLVNIRVGRLAKGKDKKERVSSNGYFLTDDENWTIRFGDITLDGGGTMEQMLMQFDPDQIFKFDYSNDPDDPNNPFHGITDATVLRRKIDEFMDPRKHKSNHDLFKRNEQMMLAFTKHVTRLDRKTLNHFRTPDENTHSRDMSRRAFEYVMRKTYGIDEVESTYAWWWARDYIYLWGIGAYLDVDGIGFRWDGKIIGTGKWRPRRLGKDGGGNAHTFDEFLALSLPFIQAIRVSNHAQQEPLGHRSVFYWMQGGEGGHITPRAFREFDKRSNYEFKQGAEQQFVGNNLENASELIDLLSKTEYDFTGIISFDVLGNVVFDYAKARDLFGKWRKAIRYTYGKNELDYREIIWANGREKTLYDHFFGGKTRALNELICKQLGRSIDFQFKDPSDAVMMSIIAAEISEHREMFSSGHHWSIQNVLELEAFLLQFMNERGQDEDVDGVTNTFVKPNTLLTPKIFEASLKAYHTAFYKMYFSEFGTSLGSGALYAIRDGIKAFFSGKWIY